MYYIFVIYKLGGNRRCLKMNMSWGSTFNAIRRLYLLLILSEVDLNVGVCYELRIFTYVYGLFNDTGRWADASTKRLKVD
jgi:hypothetical protein